MGSPLKTAFTGLMTLAFVGWSISWCCGHPIVFDLTDLIGHSHHDHDHDHEHGHAGNTHNHGPFEHDHGGPDDADHGVEKIGVDRCIPGGDELDLSLEEGPVRIVDLRHLAPPGTEVAGPEPLARDGPRRVSTPGRAVILSSGRWLI